MSATHSSTFCSRRSVLKLSATHSSIFCSRRSVLKFPSTWKLYASNDGSFGEESVVDQLSEAGRSTADQGGRTHVSQLLWIDSPGKFRYYNLRVTDNKNHRSYV